MKNQLSYFVLFALIIITGCKKDYPKFKTDIPKQGVIDLHNVKISNVTEKSTNVSFDITVYALGDIQETGVVYSTSSDPVLNTENTTSQKGKDAKWTGNTVKISGYNPEYKYYVKAYAIHNNGQTFYSEAYSFSVSEFPIDEDDDDDDDDDDDSTIVVEDEYHIKLQLNGASKSVIYDDYSTLTYENGIFVLTGQFYSEGIGIFFNEKIIQKGSDFEKLLGEKLPVAGSEHEVPEDAIGAFDIRYGFNTITIDALHAKYANPEKNKDGYLKLTKIKLVDEDESVLYYLCEGEFSCKVALMEKPNSVSDVKNGTFKIVFEVKK